MMSRKRLKICVEGRVQGVGFRPTVFRYATERGLSGWVTNTSSGVLMEVEGDSEKAEEFLHALESAPPPQAHIANITSEWIALKGDGAFSIIPSIVLERPKTQVSSDITLCHDCLDELFNPADRRYHYPFINCTNCGPRFTIISGIPYDREQTTMRIFTMCPACRNEYYDPADRRFHAQPNACPACGPHVTLLRASKNTPIAEWDDAIMETCRLLSEGAIIAVKGLGGFHLACDATNDTAVMKLRNRKVRYDKPFALMAKNMETIRKYCEVSPEEEHLLRSPRSPIVLLKRRFSLSPLLPFSCISDSVAPNNRYLGFMLPYTPLHYLLFQNAPQVLVMTSGNLSKEPIAWDNEEALERLKGVADYFLIHNRDIQTPCDDSVTRVFSPTGREMILRRSRGYVPFPLKSPLRAARPILACGGQFNNTFALMRDDEIQVSHHIGDLENLEALRALEEGITHYQNLFETPPSAIACDLHPEYLSTKYAYECAASAQPALRLFPVQHHHAHITSCMADNFLPNQKVIGVAFDGSGYGPDGTIWGGEFLIADYHGFERVAHLACLPLAGGEAAIKEPWRMSAIYLHSIYGDDFKNLDIEFVRRIDREKWVVIKSMLQKGINSPLTSSMGRLFDAVAALLGVRDYINYEGQAAIELEMLATEENEKDTYGDMQWLMNKGNVQPAIIDQRWIIKGVVDDLRSGMDAQRIAAKFHNTIAELIRDVCLWIRKTRQLSNVALSGGVFQNMILLTRVFHLLTRDGFRVYLHQNVPPNDGGISLGQAVVAAAKMQEV
jgi:hydrogenase maturation protein HypF